MLDDGYTVVRPGPPKPNVIHEPQAFSLPRGTERYVIEGCGTILVKVEAGDTLRIKTPKASSLAKSSVLARMARPMAGCWAHRRKGRRKG